MKLKTAALIAIIGKSLAMIFWLLQNWEILKLTELSHFQIFYSATNILSSGTMILFLITFFNKAK